MAEYIKGYEAPVYDTTDIAELKEEIKKLKTDLATTNTAVSRLINKNAESNQSLAQKVIESVATKTENMNFGEALKVVKNGQKIARKGWNSKKQYVFLIQSMELTNFIVKHNLGSFATGVLAIKTSNDDIQLGWVASQTDMLSSDWYIV